MSYSFINKTWTIEGSHDFGDFSILNPEIKVVNCQIVEQGVFLQLEVVENGGMFKHKTNVSYTNPKADKIDDLIDEIMKAGFSEAKVKK